MQDISKKLKILSKMYYVLGWLCVPASFIAPVVIILSIRSDQPPFPVPVILTAIAVLTLLASLAMAGCMLFAARAIKNRKHRMFSMVVAAILCFSVPIGTIIGIFALLVLNDPQVKELFASCSQEAVA